MPLPTTTRRTLPMALLRAREVIMTHFRPMLARHSVTEQQWRVLRVLCENGRLDATELASRASILPPSLTRIIKALEERKLIVRCKTEDRRRVILAGAPAGLALIEELAPERRAIYDAIERRHGSGEIQRLLDLLETLIEVETGREAPRDAAPEARPLRNGRRRTEEARTSRLVTPSRR